MNANLLVEIRQEHFSDGDFKCWGCRDLWPCPTSRLADELQEAQTRLQAVKGLHRPIKRRETPRFFPGVFEHRSVCEHCTYYFTDPETDLPVSYVLYPCKSATAAGVEGDPR